MKTSIEIEFKTLVTEDVYYQLLKEFDLEDNVFKQVNNYFDTDDFFLRNNQMALRIRHKNDIYKMTLKRPHEDGYLYEDSIILDEETAKKYIELGCTPSDLEINKKVYPKASLTTYRVSTPYKEGRLFFDKSVYGSKTDYEIEYEADNLKEGIKIFHEFLDNHHITYQKGNHKIERVYKEFGI